MTVFVKIIKHPVTILASVGIGILFGVFFKETALLLAPVGNVYLNFFQMSVLPILITAIISSLALLMKDKNAQEKIRKIIFIFILSLLLISFFGVLVGILGSPGKNLGEATMHSINKIIKSDNAQAFEMSLSDPSADIIEKKSTIWDFFIHIVPSNIFSSLGVGNALEIVFFSIIFGVAIGYTKERNSQILIGVSQSFFEAFQKLIDWAMYVLPFGLILLIGDQVAQVGVEIFYAMIKFILLFYAGGFFVFLVATAVIWWRSGIANPLTVLRAVLDPIIISFATRSSFATLPSTINALAVNLKFDDTMTHLMVPLGTTILRFGNIFYFTIASVFVAQIYGIPIDFQGFLIIIIGSVFAGTATAGASGLLTLPMMSIILTPLGLPVEAVLIIFMAIDSIIDPMRTFLIVYCNMATTALVAEKEFRGFEYNL